MLQFRILHVLEAATMLRVCNAFLQSPLSCIAMHVCLNSCNSKPCFNLALSLSNCIQLEQWRQEIQISGLLVRNEYMLSILGIARPEDSPPLPYLDFVCLYALLFKHPYHCLGGSASHDSLYRFANSRSRFLLCV